MKDLYGIWKRMVYWLNNSVVIGQIDRQLIVSSNISCNDLSWDFIIMYVWYFAS